MTDEWVELASLPDIAAAHLMKSQLSAYEIPTRIPDEHTASINWLLSNVIGGVRVLVPKSHLEQALEIIGGDGEEALAALEAEALGFNHPGGTPPESPSQSTSNSTDPDELAHSALRSAIVGILLVFVLPYVLRMSIVAVMQKGMTARGRRNAWMALGLTLAACALWGYLLMMLIGTSTREVR
ncbi:MAG: DUF2007 domain-containing protein [Bradymonadia bacterium]